MLEKGTLTALWKFYHTAGPNEQTVCVGDLVQILDDAPSNQWKLVVIKKFVRGNGGHIWAVTVCTANGRTIWPMAHLYSLVVSRNECSTSKGAQLSNRQEIKEQQDSHDCQEQQRPLQRTMLWVRDQVTEWTRL